MMQLKGIVVGIEPDQVKTLVEYGLERRLCVFPRSLFGSEVSLEPGQECSIVFPEDRGLPRIQVLDTFAPGYSVSSETAIEDARELIGIKPGDKVTVVLPSMYNADKFSDFRGEAFGLIEIGRLLFACGISQDKLKCIFSQSEGNNQNIYSDTHVFFLGSIRSNEVLRDLFWPSLEPELDVTVPDQGDARVCIKSMEDRKWFYKDLIPKDAPVPREKIHIKDPFFVAVTQNPFDKTEYHRCIMSCGAASWGTGYGILCLTCQEATERIADHVRPHEMERPKWSIVGQVEIEGVFNIHSDLTLNDPVECLHGLPGAPFKLLCDSVTSNRIWSPRVVTEGETIANVLRKYRRLAENRQ